MTLQISGCVTDAERRDTLENIVTQTFIAHSASHTHITHQYAGPMQTSCGHTPWPRVEGHPQHKEVDNKTGYRNQLRKHLLATQKHKTTKKKLSKRTGEETSLKLHEKH